MTPLHAVCCGSADPKITKAILEAAKEKIIKAGVPREKRKAALADFVNQTNDHGDGALKLLFYSGSHENSVESARLLLEAGARLDVAHSHGETALHFGARTCGPNPGTGEHDPRHNNQALLSFLAERMKTTPGLSLDMKDKEGFTPMERAAWAGRVEAADLLSDHGALWTRQNMSHWTRLKKLPANLDPKLSSLNFFGCTALREISDLPLNLRTLDLSRCTGLTKLPDELPEHLEQLYMSNTKVKKLTTLPQNLSTLYLTNCSELEALPVLPASLKWLDLQGCTALKKLPPNIPPELTIYGWQKSA